MNDFCAIKRNFEDHEHHVKGQDIIHQTKYRIIDQRYRKCRVGNVNRITKGIKQFNHIFQNILSRTCDYFNFILTILQKAPEKNYF